MCLGHLHDGCPEMAAAGGTDDESDIFQPLMPCTVHRELAPQRCWRRNSHLQYSRMARKIAVSSCVRRDRPASTTKQSNLRTSQQRLCTALIRESLVRSAWQRPGNTISTELTAGILLLQQLPREEAYADEVHQLRHDKQVVMILYDLSNKAGPSAGYLVCVRMSRLIILNHAAVSAAAAIQTD